MTMENFKIREELADKQVKPAPYHSQGLVKISLINLLGKQTGHYHV